MPDPTAIFLARLREHCDRCARCDPADGVYCATVLPLAETFWDVRRDEVMSERTAMLAGERR